MAVTTKLDFDSYDKYLEDQKKKSATTDSGTALSYYRDAAAGKPTAAVSSTIAANREALARQAGNMRTAAAQAVAGTGALGQGQAVRGTQETEGKILQSLADSRNKEQQAIAADQSNANSVLLAQGNAENDRTLERLRLGMASETPSTKAASERMLTQFLSDNGVQMATSDSAGAYDKAVADEAENSPEHQLATLTANRSLSEAKAKAAVASAATPEAQITAAFPYDANVAYAAFVAACGDYANNWTMQRAWNTGIAPALQRGDMATAQKLISKAVSYQRNF